MIRAWSLQRKLVLALVVLLALVTVAIGAVSVVALRQNLLTRLNQQVVLDLGGPGGGGFGAQLPGLRDAVAYIDNGSGSPVAVYIGADRSQAVLTSTQISQLVAGATSQTPTTVTLTGLGDFQVARRTQQSGVLTIVGGSLAEVNTTTNSLLVIFLLVGLAAVLIAVAGGAFLVRLSLRPLERVAETAARVSEIELATGDVDLTERVPEKDTDPRTEVGKVGSALNRMLGHIEGALVARQQSEDKVRQFVADASHELRTPLASIRGYSELTRRGGHELPEDVVRALGRIESESVRMTSLVEDLLLLARLDAGRELVLGEVDLTPMVVDAIGDAYAASPDHDWQLSAGEEPVVVSGDAGRIHQVIVNLLGNARVHTPVGTTVETELRAVDGEAVLTVTDAGPGIPESLQPVLFERFARGDGSRSRATGSTGLGLAIVAAVVEAHHGRVEVESAPGRTRFTVRLPLAPQTEERPVAVIAAG